MHASRRWASVNWASPQRLRSRDWLGSGPCPERNFSDQWHRRRHRCRAVSQSRLSRPTSPGFLTLRSVMHSMSAYADTYARSINDPQSFWLEAAEAIDWYEKPNSALDSSE